MSAILFGFVLGLCCASMNAVHGMKPGIWRGLATGAIFGALIVAARLL